MRYLAVIFLFCMAGCSTVINDKNLLNDLKGEWEQTLKEGVMYFAGEKNTFNFKDTTFTIRIYSFSDAVRENDPCSVNDDWYVKGTFIIGPDKIMLRGRYTDRSFEKDDTLRSYCKLNETYSAVFDYELIRDKLYFYEAPQKRENGIILKKVK